MTKNDLSTDNTRLNPSKLHTREVRTFEAFRDFEFRSDGDMPDTNFAGFVLNVDRAGLDGISAFGTCRATRESESE